MTRLVTLSGILAANVARLRAMSSDAATYAKLGKKAGVGGGTVERVEKNTVSTKLETVEKLAEALNVHPLELLKDPRTGPLSFIELSSLEAQLVMLYRTLIDGDRDRLLLYANDLVNAGDPDRRTVANPYPHFHRRATDKR